LTQAGKLYFTIIEGPAGPISELFRQRFFSEELLGIFGF
jgi:hypothetical protein